MLSTTTRLSNLNAREKRFLVGGTIVALVLLAYLLWPSATTDQGNVELVPADRRTAAPGGAPAAPPPPVAVAPLPVVQAAPSAAPGGSPEGLRLHGVTGGGAIIALPDGSQRYVALGRDVLPGLRLQGVRVHHAILTTGTTAYRLGFSGPAVAMAPPAGQLPAPAGPGPAAITNPAEAQRQAAERMQAAQYAQVLSPRQVNGRTSGYTLRPGITIPAFERAGLRPGDTILSVNGTPLGPEQLQELAWTISNATRTDFVVERGGRRINLTLQPVR